MKKTVGIMILAGLVAGMATTAAAKKKNQERENAPRGKAVLAKLKEQKYVDDAAFAQFWKADRDTFRPRSQWLVRRELRQKGVAEEIINQVVATIDEESSAYRAALSRSRHWPQTDYQLFRRRLGEYLRRRGFGYEVINHTVERLWQERGNSTTQPLP